MNTCKNVVSGIVKVIYMIFLVSTFVLIMNTCLKQRKMILGIIVLAFLFLLLIAYRYILSNERMRQYCIKNERLILIVLTILGMLIRVIYVAWNQFPMFSDYKRYCDMASDISTGAAIDGFNSMGTSMRLFAATQPYILGYPFFLSIIYKCIPVDRVLLAQMLNVLAFTGMCVLIYFMVRETFGRRAGMLCFTLLGISPAFFLYTSLTASEYAFSFLLWVFIYLTWKNRNNSRISWQDVFLSIMAGVAIVLTNMIRPVAVLMLVAWVVWIVFLCAINWKMKIVYLLLLLCFFIAGNRIILSIEEHVIGQEVASGIESCGWTLLVGSNLASGGSWNQEDYKIFDEALSRNNDPQEAQKICWDEAVERLSTMELDEYLQLISKKFARLWGDEQFGIDWNVSGWYENGFSIDEDMQKIIFYARESSNLFYGAIILGNICFLFFGLKNRTSYSYALIMFVLGTVVFHMIVETQNRYHFAAVSVLIFLGGCGYAMLVQWLSKALEKLPTKIK